MPHGCSMLPYLLHHNVSLHFFQIFSYFTLSFSTMVSSHLFHTECIPGKSSELSLRGTHVCFAMNPAGLEVEMSVVSNKLPFLSRDPKMVIAYIPFSLSIHPSYLHSFMGQLIKFMENRIISHVNFVANIVLNSCIFAFSSMFLMNVFNIHIYSDRPLSMDLDWMTVQVSATWLWRPLGISDSTMYQSLSLAVPQSPHSKHRHNKPS